MSVLRSIALCRSTLPAFAVIGMYWGAFAAQVPVIKAGIGAQDGAFGLALLCSAIGAVAAMMQAPRLDAAAGARAMQVPAMAVAFCFLLPGLAPSLPLFAAGMFFAGAATGLLDVVMNARVSGIEARHDRGLMNLNHATFSIAYAAAAILAGFTREAGISPATVFLGLGAVTLFLLPPMYMVPIATGAEDEPNPQGHGFRRVVVLAGLITLIAFMTENATEAWSALHIERTLGGGAAEGALGPAILGLTMGLGRLAGHFVTPRGGERRVITLAALVAATGAALAAGAGSPATAYLGFAILGLGVSVIGPLALALAGQLVRNRDRARAVARTTVVGYLGFFIGPPAMGLVSQAFGLRASFGVIAFVALLLPLLLLPLRAARAAPPSGPKTPRAPAGCPDPDP